jgi:hypothetical protein
VEEGAERGGGGLLYAVGGQKLVTYTVQASPFALLGGTHNVYFGGKLIRADGLAVVHDRLGSVVARSNGISGSAVTKKDYFAYGDEALELPLPGVWISLGLI